MKGRKLYVMPAMTAADVASRRPSEPRMWTSFNTDTTTPLSERIVSHASVRIRYVTKNGAMTSSRKRFFQRPPRNAIQYAKG